MLCTVKHKIMLRGYFAAIDTGGLGHIEEIKIIKIWFGLSI